MHQPCILESLKKSTCLLDIGCGVGTLTFYLARYVRFAVGVDISSRAIEICKHAQNEFYLQNTVFKQGVLKKGKDLFDFILCSEVIEHVEDDNKFLYTLRSNLKNNGILFLTTPSKENLLYKLGFYKGFDKEVGHFRRYKKAKLVSQLKESGFDIILCKSVEGPLRNILFTTRLGYLIKFIRGPLVSIFHFFDHISGLVFGFSDIQIVAVKK